MTFTNDMFLEDHPDPASNVFLMMRFGNSPLRAHIHRLIDGVATSLDFDLVRADDRDYTGELWTNVRLCMDNSELGIAVFDDNAGDSETQNLMLELGYMFALARPCMILRERGMATPPAMLAHRLHTPFDALDLEHTLQPEVQRWLRSRRHRSGGVRGGSAAGRTEGRE